MKRLALLPLLLAAACAAETPVAPLARGDRALPPPALSDGLPPGRCVDHAEQLQALVGKPEAEVRAALDALPGIRAIRLLAPNQPATQDYRPDRVTGLLRDGVVERLSCG